METILQSLPNMCVYLDDILITGKTIEEHLQNLEKVLARLQKAEMRVRLDKCTFMLTEVEYLGHRISAAGLHPIREKIQALSAAPRPDNVSKLKSFLGLVNYYCKFLPNLSTTLTPLYSLLQKKATWTWGPEQQKAFSCTKSALTSDKVLVHYDPSKELILACDASPYGVGAVLLHRMDDGSDKPIAFASRSLAPAEKNYSQLDKEALAIVFRVKCFHQYLYGRCFTILSDYKPLQYLYDNAKGTPTQASARIQWALFLCGYQYNIEYKPGSVHANADAMSCLPMTTVPTTVSTPAHMLHMLQSLPVTASKIRRATDRDPLLSKVCKMVLQGWKETNDSDWKPFQTRQFELSVEEGSLMWGVRVVVPPTLRPDVLSQLHECHPGISRMRNLARSFVWWLKIDTDLEQQVRKCAICQQNRNRPTPTPIMPWEWPDQPWARIHVDYAGPVLGHMFLVIIDAYSKWLEARAVKSATSSATISQLMSVFATHGIPELLVSDDGTAFTSSEFKAYLQQNGIRHTTSAPYHPATNGLTSSSDF